MGDAKARRRGSKKGSPVIDQSVFVKPQYAASAGVTVPILNDRGRWTYTLTWVHCGPEAPYPAMSRPRTRVGRTHRWYPR
jgi:hypothetical protein